MAKSSEPWSARQQRHLSYKSEFTTDIRHIGQANLAADALSRPRILAVQLGLDFVAIARAQQDDPDITECRNVKSGLIWQDLLPVSLGMTLFPSYVM